MNDYIGDVDKLDGFPVSEYYKDQIKDARTINRTGSWWSAVLLMEDPSTKKAFLKFYRWQKSQGVWKTRKSFTCRTKKDAGQIVSFVNEFLPELE